jgi:glycosyltransferase involved in cell wall biosynthesis
LLLVNPQPADADSDSRKEHQKGKAPDQRNERDADAYLDLLERYAGEIAGEFLQVGSDSVNFRARAVARGLRIFGASLSAKVPEGLGASLEGGDVVTAGSEVANVQGGDLLDVCVIFDELERVRDPRLLLSHLHRLLRPDGVLFIVTPAGWPGLRSSDPGRFRPDHLFYFRNSVLQSLLTQCGFGKIIAARAEDVPPDSNVHLARKEVVRDRKILSVIVPVFNEGQTFSTAFDKLLAKQVEGLDIEIVVVESNSTDGTRNEVLKYKDHPRVKVVLEDTPKGKGHAVRTGFKHMTGDFVIIQDADLEYDLEDYEALLEPLRRGRSAFVLGARHGGSAWKMRQFNDQPMVAAILNFAHWFFTALINVGFGARLKDPFTMYKVFRRDCLYGIRFECNRFDFDWEIVINFLRKGYQPLEIPVNYRSRSFAEGKKVSFLRDPMTWFRVFLKLRMSAFDPLKEVERLRRENLEEAAAPQPIKLAQ